MRADELQTALSRNLSALYVIHGDEMLLALEACEAIRNAAKAADYLEREVLQVERSFNWGQLTEIGNSFSLFASKKLIELRIPGGKPGVEGSKALEAYAARLPDDTITMVTLPRLDRTAQNSKWFQALAKNGTVIEARSIERAQLPEWIMRRMHQQGQQLHADALQFMVDRLEGNLLAAHQEIQKLGLLYPAGELTLAEAQAAVANVARFDAFQLGEALLAGDCARFLRMLDGLQAEGEAPHLVLWSLNEELRTLYQIGMAEKRGSPLPQLLKEYRVWGNRQQLLPRALQRTNAATLRSALRAAAHVDRINKGLAQGNAWDEIRLMCLPLLNAV
ncbi:DNA polymerase III subunit delta [Chitinilyticum piscinae]|uniref:DNA polymerase III subunit delta n=1 Tax=Chitinilyticum piscinae TaxID=2866724 RepID=A0A8J7FP98_9NEIS|nr:DNA polymerase III subunit delta [Chitinilyticum piscinae]MBE9610561.1 DNA polymerase III subunit delta [Chitinilyticum piscinae]